MDKAQILSNIKLLLGITSTETNDLLNLLINRTEQNIKVFCNNDFMEDTDDDGVKDTYIFPTELESTLEDLVVYKYNRLGAEGLDREKLGSREVQFSNDIPKDIQLRLYPYRKMRVH